MIQYYHLGHKFTEVKSMSLGIIFLVLLMSACSSDKQSAENIYTAFVGAKLIDGTGEKPISNATLLIKDGRVVSVGSQEEIEIPENTEFIDVRGKTIIPGMINSHAHLGHEGTMKPEDYSKENIQDQLKLYAQYGITTAVSLGEDGEAAEPLREVVDTSNTSTDARLYIAGAIVVGDTPEDAIKMVDQNVNMGVDFLKIRVDDNLGSSSKMPEEIYKPVINRAHDYNLMLAAHMYYLDDAKKLLRAGADFLAHSVRDQEVDEELIDLLKENDVCYCATLTRDLSTFIYEREPSFFKDPFFQKGVDSLEIAKLKDPAYQQSVKEDPNNQAYKDGLQVAMYNIKILSDSGVTIAMGTDSGVPSRFQGYFEHVEMNMMSEAGMQPMEIILSATKNPAECLKLKDVGTLEEGKWADLVVLDMDPLMDVSHLRTISSVWIGGKQVEL